MIDRHINLRIPKDLHEALRKYANENGKSVSATILSACERFLDLNEHGLCPSCLTPNDLSVIFRQGQTLSPAPEEITALKSQIDELKAIVATNRVDFDEFQTSIHTLIEQKYQKR